MVWLGNRKHVNSSKMCRIKKNKTLPTYLKLFCSVTGNKRIILLGLMSMHSIIMVHMYSTLQLKVDTKCVKQFLFMWIHVNSQHLRNHFTKLRIGFSTFLIWFHTISHSISRLFSLWEINCEMVSHIVKRPRIQAWNGFSKKFIPISHVNFQ